MRKYKATGCARFFVVMLFLAPLAYVGAALYNGQDPVENFKELLNIGDSNSEGSTTAPVTIDDSTQGADDDNSADSDALENARKEAEDLKEENDALKKRIEQLESELQAAKDTSGGDE